MGWLVGWLDGWLIDWLDGWLIDWLIDFSDWLIGWFDWLSDWLIGWLTEWLIDWSQWLIDWLIDWLVGWSVRLSDWFMATSGVPLSVQDGCSFERSLPRYLSSVLCTYQTSRSPGEKLLKIPVKDPATQSYVCWAAFVQLHRTRCLELAAHHLARSAHPVWV